MIPLVRSDNRVGIRNLNKSGVVIKADIRLNSAWNGAPPSGRINP